MIFLDIYDLSRQGWELHLQMWYGDNGSKPVQCFPANQSKVGGI